MQETRCSFHPWVGKIPLEEGMATHSSTFAWRIPWTREPGGLQSMGLQRVRRDWNNLPCKHTRIGSLCISTLRIYEAEALPKWALWKTYLTVSIITFIVKTSRLIQDSYVPSESPEIRKTRVVIIFFFFCSCIFSFFGTKAFVLYHWDPVDCSPPGSSVHGIHKGVYNLHFKYHLFYLGSPKMVTHVIGYGTCLWTKRIQLFLWGLKSFNVYFLVNFLCYVEPEAKFASLSKFSFPSARGGNTILGFRI